MKGLERLEKITRVETPDYMLTRIRARIEYSAQSRMPVQMALVMTFAVLCLFFLDFQAMKKMNTQNESSIVESMSMIPQNQIYHE